jgi:hypothetical protein
MIFIVAPTELDRDSRLALSFVAIMAALGALVAGCLSRIGSAMLAGAAGGALMAGLFGAILTMHPKGLIYSFIGVPIGAVVMMFYQLEHVPPRSSHRSRRPPAPSPKKSALWDRKLDG